MKYIDLSDVERSFATMINKLIFGRNRVLKPFYESIRDNNKTDAFLRIHEIDEQLELIAERKQNVKGLYAQGIIEPAMYAKGMNDLTAEMDRLTSEKDSISYGAKTDLTLIEETRELLNYTKGAPMLKDFDAEIFERFVDKIIVKDRHHLEFQMKCGLKLTERI